MFILLKSEEMLNLFWLHDCKLDPHNPKILIYYLVNGVQIKEEYDTESEANTQLQKVLAQLKNATYGSKPIVVSELPTENISETATYLIPDEDAKPGEDLYVEYRYVNGKWELQGVTKSQLQKVQDDLDKFKAETEVNFTNTNNTVLQNKEEINTRVDNEVTTLNSTISSTKTELQNNINTTKSELEQNINTTKQTLQNNIDNTKTTLESSIETTKTELESSISTNRTELEELISNTSNSLEQSINTVNQELSESISTNRTEVNQSIDNVNSSLTELINQTKQGLEQSIENTNNTITSKLTWIDD